MTFCRIFTAWATSEARIESTRTSSSSSFAIDGGAIDASAPIVSAPILIGTQMNETSRLAFLFRAPVRLRNEGSSLTTGNDLGLTRLDDSARDAFAEPIASSLLLRSREAMRCFYEDLIGIAVQEGDRDPDVVEALGGGAQYRLNDLIEVEALIEELADLEEQRYLFVFAANTPTRSRVSAIAPPEIAEYYQNVVPDSRWYLKPADAGYQDALVDDLLFTVDRDRDSVLDTEQRVGYFRNDDQRVVASRIRS